MHQDQYLSRNGGARTTHMHIPPVDRLLHMQDQAYPLAYLHNGFRVGFKLVRVSCRSDSGCSVISRNPPAFGFIMESWLGQQSHGPHLTCWLLVFNLFLLLAPMSFSTVSPVSARIWSLDREFHCSVPSLPCPAHHGFKYVPYLDRPVSFFFPSLVNMRLSQR